MSAKKLARIRFAILTARHEFAYSRMTPMQRHFLYTHQDHGWLIGDPHTIKAHERELMKLVSNQRRLAMSRENQMDGHIALSDEAARQFTLRRRYRRRDELAERFTAGRNSYNGVDHQLQSAIDYIINQEQ